MLRQARCTVHCAAGGALMRGAMRALPAARGRRARTSTAAQAASLSPQLRTPPAATGETCPVSTEGWTRRVHFVRGPPRRPARARVCQGLPPLPPPLALGSPASSYARGSIDRATSAEPLRPAGLTRHNSTSAVPRDLLDLFLFFGFSLFRRNQSDRSAHERTRSPERPAAPGRARGRTRARGGTGGCACIDKGRSAGGEPPPAPPCAPPTTLPAAPTLARPAAAPAPSPSCARARRVSRGSGPPRNARARRGRGRGRADACVGGRHGRQAACPLSTGGRTRRVHFVQGEGGGACVGGRHGACCVVGGEPGAR